MSTVSWRQAGWEQVGWKEVVWRDSNETGGYPGALSLLWPVKLTDSGVLKSAKGNWPVYTDVPEVTADGVTPGDGPAFHYDPAIWRVGDTTYVRWTATVASADVVDDVELIDPVYIRAGYLVCKDGTGEAVVLRRGRWGMW